MSQLEDLASLVEVEPLKLVPQSPTCESCLFLSDGLRCQRITSSNYSRKVLDGRDTGCDQWAAHFAWPPKRREAR